MGLDLITLLIIALKHERLFESTNELLARCASKPIKGLCLVIKIKKTDFYVFTFLEVYHIENIS